MSPSQSGADGELRAIAFASADGSSWGAAISDGGGWSLVSGPDGSPSGAVTVSERSDGGWLLEGDDGAVSLLAEAEEPPAAEPGADRAGEPDAPQAAFVPGDGPERCRVTGRVGGDDVDWRGIRVRLVPGSAKEAPGSARFVAGWFEDGSAVGLIAARPRNHDRPDHDLASATLFDPERWLPVTEPRLSTTYDRSETPARMNLELWVGEGEHEYPRRAAGEAAGEPVAVAESPALQVTPLRCHSRGEEGLGLYVLATF